MENSFSGSNVQIILKANDSDKGYRLKKAGVPLSDILDIISYLLLLVHKIAGSSESVPPALTEDEANMFLCHDYGFECCKHLDFSRHGIVRRYKSARQIPFDSSDFLNQTEGLFITSLADIWKSYAHGKDFAVLGRLYGLSDIKDWMISRFHPEQPERNDPVTGAVFKEVFTRLADFCPALQDKIDMIVEPMEQKHQRLEREAFYKELVKVYPDKSVEELEQMIVLVVQAEIYSPYGYSLSGNAVVKSASGEKIFEGCSHNKNISIRTPYPNKSWNQLAFKSGRKVFQLGIPLLFNNFSDMKENVSCIEIEWRANDNESRFSNDEPCHIWKISYDIHLVPHENSHDHIYSLASHDFSYRSVAYEKHTEYLQKNFEAVYKATLYKNKRPWLFVDRIDPATSPLSSDDVSVLMESYPSFWTSIGSVQHDNGVVFFCVTPISLKPSSRLSGLRLSDNFLSNF